MAIELLTERRKNCHCVLVSRYKWRIPCWLNWNTIVVLSDILGLNVTLRARTHSHTHIRLDGLPFPLILLPRPQLLYLVSSTVSIQRSDDTYLISKCGLCFTRLNQSSHLSFKTCPFLFVNDGRVGKEEREEMAKHAGKDIVVFQLRRWDQEQRERDSGSSGLSSRPLPTINTFQRPPSSFSSFPTKGSHTHPQRHTGACRSTPCWRSNVKDEERIIISTLSSLAPVSFRPEGV